MSATSGPAEVGVPAIGRANQYPQPDPFGSLSGVYTLVPGRRAAEDVFIATAARMSACNAFSSILSPS